MRTLTRSTTLGLLMACCLAPAVAQIPDEYTNLEVLPKEIGKRELVSVMRDFASALGVRCIHCHVGDDPRNLDDVDFASDEREAKRVARGMMRMTRQINEKLLPATGRQSTLEVRCVTCHRKQQRPESLDRLILRTVQDEGIDRALETYRTLRDDHLVDGSYDFSPGTLNVVAETLAQERDDVAGAIAAMKLNVELNPDAAYSHLLLGRIYAAAGDKPAAIASLERCLALEPDNGWARRVLASVRGSD